MKKLCGLLQPSEGGKADYPQPCAVLVIWAPKAPHAWKPHPWVSGSRPGFLANGTCVSVGGRGRAPKETEGFYDSLFIPPSCLSQANKIFFSKNKCFQAFTSAKYKSWQPANSSVWIVLAQVGHPATNTYAYRLSPTSPDLFPAHSVLRNRK